jgi:SWI/SNF-related matrix-associated actin-dependent regulator of chromatin subfamily A-like protein 1
MLLTDDQILQAFPWGQPKIVKTHSGTERQMRKSAVTPEAYTFFQNHRAALSIKGVVYGLKDRCQTIHEFTWWQPVPKEVLDQREASLRLSMATDTHLEVPMPEGESLRGYQRAGVHFALARHGTLIGDEPGLGKTSQVIGVLNMRPKWRDVLIICPNRVRLHWVKELQRFSLHSRTVGLAESGVWPSAEVVIIHYEVLTKFEARLSSRLWDLVVCDEAHRAKDPKTKRARVIFGFRPSREEAKKGVVASSGIPNRNRIALTGTPICNRPRELFPIISWLDPVNWGNYWKFLNDYCGGQDAGFNGASRLSELQRRLRETVMIRREKKDVAKEIPPKVRHIISLPATTEAAREALRRERQALGGDLTKLEGLLTPESFQGSGAAAVARSLAIPFDQVSRIRHETAVAKLPACIEFIEDLMEDEEKAVIFFHHREVGQQLQQHFQKTHGSVLVIGGQDPTVSEGLKTRFVNEPGCRLFIASLMAAGTGLDGLQHGTATVVFTEDDWVPGNIDQAEDRLCRIGQLHSVNCWHLMLAGSIDARVLTYIFEKTMVIKAALNADSPEKLAVAVDPTPPVPLPKPAKPLFGARPFKIQQGELPLVNADQRRAVHEGLRVLVEHGQLHKFDQIMGRSFAETGELSDRQAATGRTICLRYAEILGEELMRRIG